MLTRNGIIILSKGAKLMPGMLEVDFLKSPLGLEADSLGENDNYSRYRVSTSMKDNLIAHLLVVFHRGLLKMILLRPKWPGTGSSWAEWSEEEELRIQELNSKLLEQYLEEPPPYNYQWGSVVSAYDPRGGFSSIVITYK